MLLPPCPQATAACVLIYVLASAGARLCWSHPGDPIDPDVSASWHCYQSVSRGYYAATTTTTTTIFLLFFAASYVHQLLCVSSSFAHLTPSPSSNAAYAVQGGRRPEPQ